MKTHIRVLPTSMCTYNVGTIIENKQHCSLLTLTHTLSLSQTRTSQTPIQTLSLSQLPIPTSQTHKQSLYRIPIHPKHTFTNSQRKAHKYICIQPNSNRTMQTYTHKASIRLPTQRKHKKIFRNFFVNKYFLKYIINIGKRIHC